MNSDSLNVWADLANRIFEQATELGQSAVAIAKAVAPELWEIVMRQVYIEVWTDCVAAWVFLGVVVVVFFAVVKMGRQRLWDGGEWIPLMVFGNIMNLIGLVWVLYSTAHLVGFLYNPEYAAIQRLAELAGLR